MVLKFLTAGLISAILAGAAIFLLLDDDTVDRIRAERERITLSDARSQGSQSQSVQTADTQRERRNGTREPDMLDRLLGRDLPQTDATQDRRTLPDDSRIGRRLAPETEPGTGRAIIGGFDVLLEQAAMLDIADVRDDAYLAILDHALAEDRMDVAAEIVPILSAPPLRDTARQRIGVAHARAGMLEDAFAVLEDVEIDGLLDPIRLEIIRAATDTAR
ncbi:MAG: hypothetical protein AAF311_05635 [Pseudomonadota bacterium]